MLKKCWLVAVVVAVGWLQVGHTTTLQADGLRAALRASAVPSKIMQVGMSGVLGALLLFAPLTASAHDVAEMDTNTAQKVVSAQQEKDLVTAPQVVPEQQEETTLSRDRLAYLIVTVSSEPKFTREAANRIWSGDDSSRLDRVRLSFARTVMMNLDRHTEIIADMLPDNWQDLYSDGVSISRAEYAYERRYGKKVNANKIPPLPVTLSAVSMINSSSGEQLAYNLGKLKSWAEEAQRKVRIFERQKEKKLLARKKRLWRWAGRY